MFTTTTPHHTKSACPLPIMENYESLVLFQGKDLTGSSFWWSSTGAGCAFHRDWEFLGNSQLSSATGSVNPNHLWEMSLDAHIITGIHLLTHPSSPTNQPHLCSRLCSPGGGGYFSSDHWRSAYFTVCFSYTLFSITEVSNWGKVLELAICDLYSCVARLPNLVFVFFVRCTGRLDSVHSNTKCATG